QKTGLASNNEVEKALLVVDGKKYPSLCYYEQEAKMNELNIKSINVLKGASAVAVYGEEGKNGVIEITTTTAPLNIITGEYADKESKATSEIDMANPLFVIDGE